MVIECVGMAAELEQEAYGGGGIHAMEDVSPRKCVFMGGSENSWDNVPYGRAVG